MTTDKEVPNEVKSSIGEMCEASAEMLQTTVEEFQGMTLLFDITDMSYQKAYTAVKENTYKCEIFILGKISTIGPSPAKTLAICFDTKELMKSFRQNIRTSGQLFAYSRNNFLPTIHEVTSIFVQRTELAEQEE